MRKVSSREYSRMVESCKTKPQPVRSMDLKRGQPLRGARFGTAIDKLRNSWKAGERC